MITDAILSEEGCDRATAYHMSNKIVRHRDGLFITWLDKDYINVVAKVDETKGAVLESVKLGRGRDNHCGAAMTVTPDERLHVVLGAHADAGFIYRHNDHPGDVNAWSLPESVGAASTYPSLVSSAEGKMLLAYRNTIQGSRWKLNLQSFEPAEGHWSYPSSLAIAVVENYTFWGNHLSIEADGTIHALFEFFKTYKDNCEESRSIATTHAYSRDGGKTWCHDDDRLVHVRPFGIEDANLIAHDPKGSTRASNLVKLPDGRLATAVWNSRLGNLTLHLREEPGRWRAIDLTEAATCGMSEGYVNSYGCLKVDHEGNLAIVTTVAPSLEWADGRQNIRCLWLDPNKEEVCRSYHVPKSDSERAAWLPSMEQGNLEPSESPPLVIYTDGNRGEGCVNDAQCRVRLLRLDSDLSD